MQHQWWVISLFLCIYTVQANAHKGIYFKRTTSETVARIVSARTLQNEMHFPYGLPMCQMEQFNIHEKLGSGRFGEVFQVSRKKDHQPFALKKAIRNVSNEVEILSRLKGLGITPDILCAGENQTFFIMEKINGVTLDLASEEFWLQRLQSQGIAVEDITLNKPEVLRSTAVQMFSILKYLHQQNIYHCDGNVENWMVRNHTLEPVIIDFGCGGTLNSWDQLSLRRPLYKLDLATTTNAINVWSEELDLQEDDLPPSFQILFESITKAKISNSDFPTIDTVLQMLNSN